MVPPSDKWERYERFINLVKITFVDGEVIASEEKLVKRYAGTWFHDRTVRRKISRNIEIGSRRNVERRHLGQSRLGLIHNNLQKPSDFYRRASFLFKTPCFGGQVIQSQLNLNH